MKKVIRLTESDLVKLVNRVVKEQEMDALYGAPEQKQKHFLETEAVRKCLDQDKYSIRIDSNTGIMTARRESPYTDVAYIMVKSTPLPGKFIVYIQYKQTGKSLPVKKGNFQIDSNLMSNPLKLCQYIKEKTFVS